MGGRYSRRLVRLAAGTPALALALTSSGTALAAHRGNPPASQPAHRDSPSSGHAADDGTSHPPGHATSQAAGRTARQTATAGVIATIAGGVGGPALGTKVAVSDPCGVAYVAGHAYVSDINTVRTVSASTGRLTTTAGLDAPGPLGDGGPASAAALVQPCQLAGDKAGNLLFADHDSQRIQEVGG